MARTSLFILASLLLTGNLLAQETHRLLTTIKLDSVPIACSLSSDNRKLLITTGDGHVLMYDLRLSRVVRKIPVEGSPLYIHRFSQGKFALVSYWNGRRVGLFDLYANRLMRNVPTGDGPTFFAQYNQTILLAQARERKISFLNNLNFRSSRDLLLDGTVGGLAVAPERHRAYVIVGMHKIAVIDLASRSVLHSFEIATARESPLIIDPEERWLFALGPRNSVLRISLDEERESKRIAAGGSAVGLSRSKDGKYLFVCHGLEGTVAIFEANTLTELEQVQVGARPAFVETSSDNQYVLVCNRGSKTISILERVRPFSNHKGTKAPS